MSKHQQQGVAIILVLLIVAIATSLAAYIATQQSLWQRQVESQLERAQTRQLGAAGIDWARAILNEDARTNPGVDHLKELWTLQLPAIPIESGEVLGRIEDRQGLFNLNNLPTKLAQFEGLLSALDLPAELAPALADWIDIDNVPLPGGGAEDEYYLALPQPYRSSGKPLVELGELLKVKGFNNRIIERLRNYVSVLPKTDTKVNVNFAKEEVLMAVTGMVRAEAKEMVRLRSGNYYKSVDDFDKRWQRKNRPLNPDLVTVQSDFFWVTGTATVGKAKVETQVLVERGIDPRVWPTVKWQSVQ